MRFTTTFALAATLLQAAPPPQSQTPQPSITFKVEVNYVEVDASVTDAQGHFVRGLTRDDFKVVEAGVPQTLTAFSMVDIPVERVDPPLYTNKPIPADVVSNRQPFEGRVFVIVLDDLNTAVSRTPRARAAARQFVERYVGANDMVAVVDTSGYGKAMQDFTSNRALAVRAIDGAIGNKEESSTQARLQDYYMNRDTPGASSNMNASFNDMMRYNNARNTLRTLKGLADYMAGMRGRRKAVVFFSEGINYDLVDAISNPHTTDVQNELHEFIAAATRGNISVYTVDPRGLASGMEDAIEIGGMPADGSINSTQLVDEMRLEHDSLHTIAEETGGFAVLNQNDYADAFGRILEDSSSYYVIGYYPTNDKHDGRFRNVTVTVNRPGLKVRTRRGYIAPVPTKKESAAKGTPAERTSAPLMDALGSPIPISGLTLSAFAAPFKGAPGRDAITLSLEVDGTTMQFAPRPDGHYANELEVTLYAIESGAGKVRDGAHDTVSVVLKPNVTTMRSPFRVVRVLKVPPGKYQVRVGAREGGGNVGTVICDLDAPDFSKGPIAMSGLVLSSAESARVPTANPAGNDLKDVLPAPPSASREFSRGDELTVFAEVYDNLGTSTPHRVVIKTTVLSDDGKSMFSTSDERRSEELSGSAGSGGYGQITKIPLSTFAPGRYVLHLEATPTIGKPTPVTREVEFRVR
ncbi:MAG TPA: VWA domain-containing protein [Vicinamibacterales bacterium]|jgi:VWFA-related protein